MDLGAYVQTEDLHKLAEKNGIDIPRLRGYRLMSKEDPISQEEINNLLRDCAIDAAECLITSVPSWRWGSNVSCFSPQTDKWKKYYLIEKETEDGYRRFVGIRWDRIHGRKRKELKFAIKQCQKAALAQWNMWNKYAGQANVLYIHARIGGDNWNYFGCESLKKEPWFLDRVDDSWDNTYCDIYAKISDATM